MKDFAGKVAVVTGAASGIGFALAEKCLAEGMQVVMADIEAEALLRAAEKLMAGGNNAVLPVQTDVARLEALEELAETAFSRFGGVHLLFNNAGVGGRGTAVTSTTKDWEWIIGVNLMSVIHGVRIFAPRMLAQNEPGHIINTASVAGLIGGVNAGYAVTKHGVVALTESLYAELRQTAACIGASVLCPGLINTNIMDSASHRPAYVSDDIVHPEPSAEVQARMTAFRAALAEGMAPSQLADIVFDGIRAERLYILTHTDFNEIILGRANNICSGTNPVM